MNYIHVENRIFISIKLRGNFSFYGERVSILTFYNDYCMNEWSVIISEIFQKICFQLQFLKAVFTLSIQRIADQEIWVTIFFQNKTLFFFLLKVTSPKITSKSVITSWRVFFVRWFRWFWRSLCYEFSWQRSIITYYGEIIGGWNSLQL